MGGGQAGQSKYWLFGDLNTQLSNQTKQNKVNYKSINVSRDSDINRNQKRERRERLID